MGESVDGLLEMAVQSAQVLCAQSVSTRLFSCDARDIRLGIIELRSHNPFLIKQGSPANVIRCTRLASASSSAVAFARASR